MLDLTGAGINVTQRSSSDTFFDTAGDGYLHRTAWAGVGNGVLAIDADGDGEITERKEITFTDWDPSAKDDMAALRSVFDTNNDGVLSGERDLNNDGIISGAAEFGDAEFSKFRIVVTNADGTTSVKTLAELGIASINLTTDATKITLPDGSSIDGQTTFTRTNGTTGTAAAVTLASEAQGYTLDDVATFVDGNGWTVVTNRGRNADGSLANESITKTKVNGVDYQRVTTFDYDGDGIVDKVQSIDVVTDSVTHIKTETLINKNAGGVLLDRTVTTTSADGKSVSISRDTRGTGIFFDEIETRTIAVGGDLTIGHAYYNNNTLIRSESVTTTNNGLTRTELHDLDGDTDLDLKIIDATVVHGVGSTSLYGENSRTRVVEQRAGDNTLISMVTTDTDATGEDRTVVADLDGDGNTDLTSISTVDAPAGGPNVTTIVNKNGDGFLRDKSATSVSADGLTVITQRDIDGDDLFDVTTNDETVLDIPSGDRTQTIAVTSHNGTLLSETIIIKDGDGRGRDIQIDRDGDGHNDRVETIVVQVDGTSIDTAQELTADGDLIWGSETTTSKNGLSTTTKIDADGDHDVDAIVTSVTVIGDSSEVTETVRNKDTSLRSQTITTTTANGMSVTVQMNSDGNETFERIRADVTVLNGDGSYVETVTDTFANDDLGAESVTSVSADRSNISAVRDLNGDGHTDQTETIVRAATGIVTDTITNFNADGSLISKAVITTSANGLSKTTEKDLDGDTVADRVTTDIVTLNANGSRTEIVTDKAGNGSQISQVIQTVSANGLTKTTLVNANGDATIDLKTIDITVLNTNGSTTRTVTDFNTDLSKRDEVSTNVSDDGLSVTTLTNVNGDIHTDLTTTDVTILNANGSTTRTVTNTNDSGLRDQSVTTTSADGRTVTQNSLSSGSVNTKQSYTRIVEADGDIVETVSNLSPTDVLLNRTNKTTSANGLVVTSATDQNGDGTVDYTTRSITVLNDNGSTTQTVTRTNAAGLISKTVQTVSASGLISTTQSDDNGDGTFDLTEVSVTTLNADGSTTKTVTETNADNSNRSQTVTQVSGDQKTVTVTEARGGVVVKQETSVLQNNGDTVDTVASFSTAGVALSSLVTTTSANGLTETVQLKDAAGAVLDTQITQKVLNADGSVTETFTQDGSVDDKIVTTTSADGLSTTIATSLLGGQNTYDQNTTDVIVLNADGSRTETITTATVGSALKDQATITTSDDGLSRSVQLDLNGDNVADNVTTIVIATDGSKTETFISQSAINGLLLRKDVTVTSADGRTRTLQRDSDGNGVFDQFETTVLNADGSVTTTRTGTGVGGAPSYNEVKTKAIGLDGGTIETSQHFDSRGSLLDKTVTTVSADGLLTKSLFDTNGDGVTDQIGTDTITLNADGSQSRVEEFRYAAGLLKARTVTTTSADGSTANVTLDNDGNGIIERAFTLTTAADGSRTTTVIDYSNTTGVQTKQTVYTTSANALAAADPSTMVWNVTNVSYAIVKEILTPLGHDHDEQATYKVVKTVTTTTDTVTFLDTKTEFAQANGSYEWVRTNAAQLAGSASHVVDANGVDTWSWNISNTTLWGQTTTDVVVAASGSIQIDLATEQKYIDQANALYVTLLDRGMSGDEREMLAQYIQNGSFNQKFLATNIIASAEFTAKYGTLTNAAFIDLIYKNALGDWRSSLVQNDYLSKVTATNMTLADVAIAVAANAADLDVIRGEYRDGVVSNTVSYANALARVTASITTPSSNAGEAVGDSLVGIANLIGTNFSDSLTGDATDNIFVGGLGADALVGGSGNDTSSYALASAGVTANLTTSASNTGEAAGDTYSSIDNLIGSAFNDVLMGTTTANVITGGAGGDAMDGGAGIDTASYTGSNAGVTVDLTTGAASGGDATGDTVVNFENLTGSAFNDVLSGTSVANSLDGGAGNDTLTGGLGNDTYVVDSSADVIVEVSAGGTDAVQSTAATYTLSANVENLTLMGAGNINGTGNDLANTITGNAGANVLDGGIEATAAIDTLKGGKGDDTYIVRNTTDVVTELTGEGTDTVDVRVTGYTMAGFVENLTIGGGLSGITATGNTLDNKMIGNELANTLLGGTGNDILIGGAGADALTGGAETLDIASYETATVGVVADLTTVANNTGDAAGDTYTTIDGLTGSAFNDTLRGNTGVNRLDGGAGIDTLEGGNGNDTYVVDNAGDIVTELSGTSTGTDSVETLLANYTLTANVENLTLTGAGNINGTGNDLANTITGNAGANILDGGIEATAAIDTLKGGKGDDTYIVRNTTDVVTELTGEGTDTIDVRVTGYTMAGFVENLTIGGGLSGITATGNTLNNTMIGNELANTLLGGTGNDILIGGAGADALTGGAETLDIASYETATVGVVADLTMVANNTGDAAGDTYTTIDGLTGSAFNDTLRGNTGANRLDGGAGIDTLEGGNGNDTYVVDNAGDIVTELSGTSTGTDSVETLLANYTLTANVENLTLTGAGNINGTGNDLANTITGNAGANILDGGIEATAAIDTLKGGKGDDTYIVRNTTDVVTELTGEGTDTVDVRVTGYTMAGFVENLTIGGGLSGITATGNTLDNKMIGNELANTLLGGTGNDILIGGAGADALTGGAETLDIASYETATVGVVADLTTVANNTGDAAGDTYTTIDGLTGSAFNDTLRGNTGANRLDGGAGIDTLEGGNGNDTYVVDNAGDIVTELSGTSTGTDSVETFLANYTLTANVENLTLLGAGNINGTGNGLANTITGNAGANVLDGGTDALIDTMKGGKGDDTYIVRTATDLVTELTGEGTDTIDVRVTGYTMAGFVENLTIGAGLSGITATGNTLNNIMTGNSLSNSLDGGNGDDVLDGGAGNDAMTGGAGIDTVTYANSNAAVTVDMTANTGSGGFAQGDTFVTVENLIGSQFNDAMTGTSGDNSIFGGKGDDTLSGAAGIDRLYGEDGSDILIGGAGADVLSGGIGVDTASYVGSAAAVVVDLAKNTATGGDAAGDSLTSIENLTGSGLADTLIGSSGNNILDGGAGADILDGGDGTDTVTYSNSQAAVFVSLKNSAAFYGDAEGDTLFEIENLTGSTFADTLIGDNRNNKLDGGAGADTMDGGDGADTYVVDNVNDVITERADSVGSDLVLANVTITLGQNVENLVLTGTSKIDGTGNELTNRITGNSNANQLDGGIGADYLAGGGGNDIYFVDNVGDVTIEDVDAGIDLVLSSISTTLGTNVECLTLTGSDEIDGTGNDLNNILTGNGAANKLDGSAGADTMVGAAGNDIYVVDNIADVTTENAGEGIDLVFSSVATTLSANIENLTLTGGLVLNGTGNTLDNVIVGNSADNQLDGGTGVDTLAGGLGNDMYVVDNVGDVVTESAGEGIDLVQSSASHMLGLNVENLTLTGSGGINGAGNALDNIIIGNSGANELTGGDGADTLDGGAGIDKLIGGAGNDTYVINSSVDVVTEIANEGIDTVLSSITYTLGDNVENLTLIGTANPVSGTGNALNNVIIGNSYNNTLTGKGGADLLDGGSGVDWANYSGSLTGVTVSLAAGTGSGGDAEGDTLVNIENLSGSSQNDSLTGDAGDNRLVGGFGSDKMFGGLGNDTYDVNLSSDVVTENAGEGTDTVETSTTTYTLSANVENLILTGTSGAEGTGNELDNVIIGAIGLNILNGAAGNDRLDGRGGNDFLNGGSGNDTYVVDNIGDVVTENANEGIDAIESSVAISTLAANVENLTLTGGSAIGGAGNALDNQISGNSAANTLTGADGNDTLDGGDGNDTLIGGQGADEFRFGRSGGVDIVDAYDTDGGADKLSIASGVAIDQVWFSQSGNDLIMTIIGTNDTVTVQGWYSSTDRQLNTVQLSDGKYATASDVEQLRSAMASFSPPPLGQLTLDSTTLQALTPTLAAAWH